MHYWSPLFLMSLCERGFHPSLAIKTVNRMDSAGAAMNGQQRDRLHGYRFFFSLARRIWRAGPSYRRISSSQSRDFGAAGPRHFFWSEE